MGGSSGSPPPSIKSQIYIRIRKYHTSLYRLLGKKKKKSIIILLPVCSDFLLLIHPLNFSIPYFLINLIISKNSRLQN